MLANHVEHDARQMILEREIHPFFYVALDDQRGERRIVEIVRIDVGPLIFGEVFRLHHFTDVVEQGTHAGPEGTGPDGVGGVFRQLGYDQ